MILCIGSVADETFWAGVAALARRHVATKVLDVVELAVAGSVSGALGRPLELTVHLDGEDVSIASFSGIWVRLTGVSGGAPDAALARRAAALEGALGLICSRASTIMPVINPPANDRSNFTKLLHTVLHSRERPWKTPRSCLTNDPAQARDFAASCESGAIYKGVSAVKTWASSYDDATDESRLDLISACPVLFQERIPGPDIRVHVVGSETFAEQIESENVDYRTSRSNIYERASLADAVSEACVSLTREMGLRMSGVDFKRHAQTGELYFLEANSMPCFEGYDRRAGGAIGDALVRSLCSASD